MQVENLLKTNNYKSYLEIGDTDTTHFFELAKLFPHIKFNGSYYFDRDLNFSKLEKNLAEARKTTSIDFFNGLVEEFFTWNKLTYDVIYLNNKNYSYNTASLDFCEAKRILNNNGVIIVNKTISSQLWKEIKHKDCTEINNLGIWKKAEKVNLNNVTVVLSAYRNYEAVEPVISTMLNECNFKRIIILTPDEIDTQYENILLPKMSISDYSVYVIKQLINDIKLDTEFILLTQPHGFVIDGSAWKNEFLDYDYIGAPWPSWVHPHYRVGNGGFSLRSKKLMTILQDNKYTAQHPEDAQICRILRPALEKENIEFAPIELAEWFSYESMFKTHQTFGFHAESERRYYLSYKYKNTWFYK